MAVYTEVDRQNLGKWLEGNYRLPSLAGMTPITEGIENSNYLLTLDDGARLVFTVFEVWNHAAVTNYALLCLHLASSGLPVPFPLPCSAGGSVSEISGKPALLVPFAEGAWAQSPTADQCRIMGGLVAQLHNAAGSFAPQWDNPRGVKWWPTALCELKAKMPEDAYRSIETEALQLANNYPSALPGGICHCDLFRNNVLWTSDRTVSAVIDFYFGGGDLFIFDLAVCANDWCVDAEGRHDIERMAALFSGYRSVRNLKPEEIGAINTVFRCAAMRFWLSRLHDIHYPRDAILLTPHNPVRFERIHASCAERHDEIRHATGG